jgi:hypothetical protein
LLSEGSWTHDHPITYDTPEVFRTLGAERDSIGVFSI